MTHYFKAYLFVVIISVNLMFFGCSGNSSVDTPAAQEKEQETNAPLQETGIVEAELDDEAEYLFSQMTLKEKIEQMTGEASILSNETLEMIKAYNNRPITTADNIRLGIPGIHFSDGTKGLGVGNSTCFPVSMARGATWDTGLEFLVGDAIGVEARSQDVNFFGGVSINVLRHPAWGRAQETYGEDPFLLGEMGSAIIKGVQQHVMACVKHFALNSIENSRFYVDVQVDERTLREIYLPHFKRCVDEGAASVMSAYNKVNGIHCGQNPYLLRDILKEEWGFRGFVMSDFFFGIRDSKEAANAGLDVEMPFHMLYYYGLPEHIKKGDVAMSVIDEAVLRILRQKIRFSRIGQPWRYGQQAIASPEHATLARKVAQESIVLLKNEAAEDGKPLLPLGALRKKIAVIGRLADVPIIGDDGSSSVRPPYVITPLQGLQNARFPDQEIIYDQGICASSSAASAKSADVVIIVVGNTSKDEGEFIPFMGGGDRKRLTLSAHDEALIDAVASANPNVVVIMMGGGPFITEAWRSKVPAIMMAWYPGMEGGNAMADILFGKVCPSGKLPCVFPKSEDQLPFFDSNAKTIRYEYYHGYRLMDKRGYEPAFSFGFGLSYTTFSYSNLWLDADSIGRDGTINVKVDITNTGRVAGEEIAQMYAGCVDSSIDRPVKDLKGFARVMLEPGMTKTIHFSLRAKDLAYYDEGQKTWIVEAAKYEILAGPSSRPGDLLAARFKVVP